MTRQLQLGLTRAAVGSHRQKGTQRGYLTWSECPGRIPGEGDAEACIGTFQEKRDRVTQTGGTAWSMAQR